MPRFCPYCDKQYDDGVLRCPEDDSPTYRIEGEEQLVGKTIDNRFTIGRMLGGGGMGEVYRAHQHSMRREVAVKVIRRHLVTDRQAIQRFHREAEAASRLKNPHTITVFDFGQTEDDLLYIVMELLEGKTLSQEIGHDHSPMRSSRAVGIILQLLDALEEAHAANVLHRDLKPDNIFLLDVSGPSDFIKVLDFGIAKVVGEKGTGLTSTGMAIGTPTYMSPEQAQGQEMDARGDLYSVGVILFEMLAGKPPFTARTPLALLNQKVNDTVPTIYRVNPSVLIPKKLEETVSTLLSIDPGNRPADVQDTRELLADAMGSAFAPAVPMPDVRITSHGTTEIVSESVAGNDGAKEPIIPQPPKLEGFTTTLPKKRLGLWILIVPAVVIAVAVVWMLTRGIGPIPPSDLGYSPPPDVMDVFVDPGLSEPQDIAEAPQKQDEATQAEPVPYASVEIHVKPQNARLLVNQEPVKLKNGKATLSSSHRKSDSITLEATARGYKNYWKSMVISEDHQVIEVSLEKIRKPKPKPLGKPKPPSCSQLKCPISGSCLNDERKEVNGRDYCFQKIPRCSPSLCVGRRVKQCRIGNKIVKLDQFCFN